jgi:hypothetical protein
VLVLGVVALTRPSPAALINYGTYSAPHFTFVNVTEDSTPAEPLPLFGPPISSGDSIDFNPVGFDALSTGGGTDPTESNLTFALAAKSGSRIRRMLFSEAGDTTLGGNVAPGSSGTASVVSASGTLRIHEVDFQAINPISVPFSLSFSPSGGTFFLGTDGGGGPIFHTQWTGSITLDVEAILIANGITITPGLVDPDSGATRVSIDLDDTLEAASQQATSATIAKKDFGAVVTRANVPGEPGGDPEVPETTSCALLGLALAVPMLRRRRGARTQGATPRPLLTTLPRTHYQGRARRTAISAIDTGSSCGASIESTRQRLPGDYTFCDWTEDLLMMPTTTAGVC